MAETSNKNNRHNSTPIDNKYGHLQPQAPDIERLVLGALMVDKDAFSMISELVRPETFYEPRNQKIFQAIQTLSLAEKPVDIATVTEQLKRDGTLEDVGGPIYLLDLNQHVASSAHIEYHAKILAQKFLARQLISYASTLETKAFDETIDVGDANMTKIHAGAFGGLGIRSLVSIGNFDLLLKLSATYHQGFIDTYTKAEKEESVQAINVNAYKISGNRLPRGLEVSLSIGIPLKAPEDDACATFSRDRYRRRGSGRHLFGF